MNFTPVSVDQFSSVRPFFHSEFKSPSIEVGFRPEKSKPDFSGFSKPDFSRGRKCTIFLLTFSDFTCSGNFETVKTIKNQKIFQKLKHNKCSKIALVIY